MLFNSWQYIFFFLGVLVIYFSIKHKWRIHFLFIASYLFYSVWSWKFALLMFGVSILNFFCGKKIFYASTKKAKKKWFTIALVFSLLPLFYFKYANFFIDSFSNLAYYFGVNSNKYVLNVILPVGISFFTFQALSYSIDIYRKRVGVETSLIRFTTYVAFFPQLVAGPIERSTNLLQQFYEKHEFDVKRFVEGGKLFIWGLFKKIVIADRLALYSDSVFNNPEAHSGTTLIVATVFFTFQIYCDFSGYSDMAIGSARMLGFRLMQNFNLPYLSNSIGEFWKRWHISLSTWFSDYVYIPLGGNRVSIKRWVFNILVVFLLSGLWHGANFTFVIWGALHAFYYLIEFIGKKMLTIAGGKHLMEKGYYKFFKIVIVFTLVCFAWIFFRANSVSDAFLIITKIASFSGHLWTGVSSVTTVLSVLLILLLVSVQILQFYNIVPIYFSKTKLPWFVQWLSYAFLLITIALFGMSSNAFIYFQF
ncbi:membrane-bound O-acyltransferase family protein [Polaribacter butkevichii]|uniref:Membrane-bound O-acyltransferase family protein n=1 Tax=Polaribacter butkevichii TaxID=218490 RepID=A0A2P6CDU5_9FLAO|nr:membrane-bound O-acyltransferase family protein [Polaribacter butkevichii]